MIFFKAEDGFVYAFRYHEKAACAMAVEKPDRVYFFADLNTENY